MRQYFRNWRLQITPYQKTSKGKRALGSPVEVKDLRMMLNVLDTALGDPLTASLQIYNLSPTTKNILNTKLCYITLEVGYGLGGENLLPIFEGEVTNSYELRVGPDLIQNIFARDSGTALNESVISLASYTTPTPVSAILMAILTEAPDVIGTPDYLGSSQAVINSADSLDDWVFGGTLSEELNELLTPLGLRWYISGGVVRIIKLDDGSTAGPGDSTPFEVSVETGLLSRPKVDWVGIEFEHLMNPGFKPGNLITIKPQTVQRDFGNELYVPIPGEIVKLSGTFRVMEARHKGNTRGSEWKTIVKAFHKVG